MTYENQNTINFLEDCISIMQRYNPQVTMEKNKVGNYIITGMDNKPEYPQKYKDNYDLATNALVQNSKHCYAPLGREYMTVCDMEEFKIFFVKKPTPAVWEYVNRRL